MPSLFDSQERDHLDAALPLAARMRPRTLGEFAGQTHFLGEDKLLRRMLAADRIGSVIFYGPPGTGKTTLARLIASATDRHFESLNAAASGVKELRERLSSAENRLRESGERTILFVDELHRFNKSQQDVLLPDVERGVVSLVGATTANPFFALVTPLLSRSQIFEFRALTSAEVESVVRRALDDEARGFGKLDVTLTDDALALLVRRADGDARRALTALEIAVQSMTGAAKRGESVTITPEVVDESIQRKAMQYDAAGDAHYDAASAFIKSIRGSDPDAALYWMARMLEGGEDPRFIARRIVISASEDIGNADPQGLVVANAAAQATEFVGMPEARIILAQAVTYLACCPKSNASYVAVDAALRDVRERTTLPVPKHLQSSSYSGAERLGRGEGYEYAHNSDDGWVDQDYLGVDVTYYEPTDRGREAEFRARLAELRRRREGEEEGESGREGEGENASV